MRTTRSRPFSCGRSVDGKSTRVTDPIFAESNPAFSPDGKFLYFLGAREWAPQISGIEFNFATNRNVGIYALTLQKNGPSPFPVQNDEAKAATEESAVDEDDKTKKEKKKENDTESKKEKAVDAIDFDGLASRVTRAPIDADNIQTLNITGKFIVYTVSDAFYYGRDGKFKPQIHVYDLKKRKDKTLVENVDSAALSDDGEKLLVQSGDNYKVYDVDGDGKDSKTVSTSGLALTRDPHQEYAEIFREVWRRYRDYFYVVNMNGYDWNALRAKYEPQLQFVGDRSDLELFAWPDGRRTEQFAFVRNRRRSQVAEETTCCAARRAISNWTRVQAAIASRTSCKARTTKIVTARR